VQSESSPLASIVRESPVDELAGQEIDEEDIVSASDAVSELRRLELQVRLEEADAEKLHLRIQFAQMNTLMAIYLGMVELILMLNLHRFKRPLVPLYTKGD